MNPNKIIVTEYYLIYPDIWHSFSSKYLENRRYYKKVKGQREYDIVTVKLLLFSYNIYLFNVLFLSYKPSFVFVYMKVSKKTKHCSTLGFLSLSRLFTSHFHSGLGKKFPPSRSFISYCQLLLLGFIFFFFSSQNHYVDYNEHRRCFQRSVDPHNERSWLSFFIIIWQCETTVANYHVFRFLLATRYRILSRYEKSISSLRIDLDEAVREIA